VTTAFDQDNRLCPLSKIKLLRENPDLAVMSETSLEKDWLTPEEDEA
jgi:hypothetical protein